MITTVDARLRREARGYCLRFTCEACAWFDHVALTCSHAYPNGQHRDIDLETVDEVVFCKEFELA
jgi:hypothetical protein